MVAAFLLSKNSALLPISLPFKSSIFMQNNIFQIDRGGRKNEQYYNSKCNRNGQKCAGII